MIVGIPALLFMSRFPVPFVSAVPTVHLQQKELHIRHGGGERVRCGRVKNADVMDKGGDKRAKCYRRRGSKERE